MTNLIYSAVIVICLTNLLANRCSVKRASVGTLMLRNSSTNVLFRPFKASKLDC